MESDDESDKNTGKLKSREEFPGWKTAVALLVMSKGDVDGIFVDDGTDPNMGYQLYPANQAGNKKREEWLKLSKKLTGRVGMSIQNEALKRIWSTELTRITTQAAAAAEKPYLFAKCMQALERECSRASETANQIARGKFTIALQSFVEKESDASGKPGTEDKNAGFDKYVDAIRKAEEVLRSFGVVMTDAEKKQLFFQHFTATTSNWPTLRTVWAQDDALTFDQILARGVTEQQALDLKSTQFEASGVRSFYAMNGNDDESETGNKRYRYDKYERGRGGGKGALYGGKGARSGKGKGQGGRGTKGGKGSYGRGRGGRGGRGGARGRTNQSNNVENSDLECWTCGGRGHRAADCPSKRSAEPRGGKDGKDIVIPGMLVVTDVDCTPSKELTTKAELVDRILKPSCVKFW